jgi:hypothetical protein
MGDRYDAEFLDVNSAPPPFLPDFWGLSYIPHWLPIFSIPSLSGILFARQRERRIRQVKSICCF